MKNSAKTFDFSDISPLCLIRTLLRNLWVILAAALTVCMCSSLYLEHFYQPEYVATMTYVVTAKKVSYYPGTSVTAAKEVRSVLSELLGNDIILKKICAYSDRLADFDGKISVSEVENSNFIIVKSTASNPESAFLSLKAMDAVFPSIEEYLSSNSVVQLIRNPSVSAYPVNAVNRSRIRRLSALGGTAVAALAICMIAIKKETVQTREGAHRLLDAHILAVIRHEKKNRTLKSRLRKNAKGLQVFSPTTSFAYSEQINSICATVEHEAAAKGRKVFLITGVGENEGKSTIAGNVAAALAMRGGNTVLLDADLRKPSLNLFFDKKYNAPLPLNKLLAEPFSNENMLRCIRRHEKLGLYMLFPLKSDPRSTELITGKTMRKLLEKLRRMDYVIIDSPPMGICPDAEALAELSDASMLVVRQDYTPACDINDAADALRETNSEFLGCILNDMRDIDSFLPGGYGYRKKYGYGYYGYGSDAAKKD